MSAPPSHDDLLVNAWASTTGESNAARFSRMSLEMFASEVPELASTLSRLQLDGRAELDLHLEGAGVQDHETAADKFGRFVSRAALAVKELAKDGAGLKRLPTALQVVGPAAGSVQVVLRSPPVHVEQAALAGVVPDTIEAVALRRVASLMMQAENSGPDDSTVEAALHGVRGQARRAVRLLAQSIVDGRWAIEGELRLRDGQVTTVRLSEAGAQRLATAAHVTEAEVERGRLFDGRVDGWTWSESSMGFDPDTGGRFKAYVGEAEGLQAAVAHLLDEPRPRVRGTFTIVTTFPPGDQRAAHKSYELTAIKEVRDRQGTFPLTH